MMRAMPGVRWLREARMRWHMAIRKRIVGRGRPVTVMVSVALVASLGLLASCAPGNAAVGDTEGTGTAIHHDSVDRGDIMIGVVGSLDSSADRTVMTAFADERLKAFYAGADRTTNSPERYARSASNDIAAMVDRAVKAIVINRLTMTKATRGIWQQALLSARNAGIPVVLIDARQLPDDARLYAATLTIDDASRHATRLDTIMQQVINDRPHARAVTVSMKRGTAGTYQS